MTGAQLKDLSNSLELVFRDKNCTDNLPDQKIEDSCFDIAERKFVVKFSVSEVKNCLDNCAEQTLHLDSVEGSLGDNTD